MPWQSPLDRRMRSVFNRRFDPGSGDCTRERKKTLGKKTAKLIGKKIPGLQKYW
jgi:hypothetical protein